VRGWGRQTRRPGGALDRISSSLAVGLRAGLEADAADMRDARALQSGDREPARQGVTMPGRRKIAAGCHPPALVTLTRSTPTRGVEPETAEEGPLPLADAGCYGAETRPLLRRLGRCHVATRSADGNGWRWSRTSTRPLCSRTMPGRLVSRDWALSVGHRRGIERTATAAAHEGARDQPSSIRNQLPLHTVPEQSLTPIICRGRSRSRCRVAVRAGAKE